MAEHRSTPSDAFSRPQLVPRADLPPSKPLRRGALREPAEPFEAGDEIDPLTLRHAFGRFPTGVAAICAMEGNEPIGMAASSFTSVSLVPPLVLFCAAHSSTTWPHLAGCERLGVSVLGEDHEDVGRALAAKDIDRFADVEWESTPSGAVLVHGSSAWFECSVHDVVRGGDHDVILLRVRALTVFPGASPLVFHASQFTKLLG